VGVQVAHSRVHEDRESDRVLQRARRPGSRRRAPRTAADTVVRNARPGSPETCGRRCHGNRYL